jgi:hypothetical protein
MKHEREGKLGARKYELKNKERENTITKNKEQGSAKGDI